MEGHPPIRLGFRFGRRSWIGALALGLLCLGAGIWGYLAEAPGNQNPVFAIAYFWLPAAMLAFVILSFGRRRWAILIALGLMSLEAALLGAGPLLALPFVVAVPFVCVVVATANVPTRYQPYPYVIAWLSSSTGVAIAVLQIVDTLNPSALVVVPAFMFVDALSLSLLWYFDTTRARALNVAAAAEVRVLDLLDGVELVGLHVDSAGRIDFINEFALKLTGWTRQEVIGKNWYDTFATPERREAARIRLRRTVAGENGGLEPHRESTILTKSGKVLLIRWSHVHRHDADGRLVGVASLGEDITDARAAEDASRRVSEMLSTLVVSSPLPTVVLNLDRTVQLWNPAAAELLGWDEAEVMGRPMPDVYVGPDRRTLIRAFVGALKGRTLDHDLIQLRRRNGSIVRVRLYGRALLDRDGRATAVGLQAVDVTQSMAIEAQLHEAQKMEAVGRLAGGVAHDFNNSLTAIGGFAAIIAGDSKEPETREAAETILAASKRAADLTRELLAYSRKSMLLPQVIEVNEMLGSFRGMLRRLLGEAVSVVIESEVPVAVVRVDPAGLERVILNLAVNARDAMPDGGQLAICIERRPRDAAAGADASGWIAITVTDTGAGILAALHSQVFDPFFTTKPVGSGTGLGLAMVKGFVVQSGGLVGLRSAPGQGTTFEILLPEVEDTREARVALTPAPIQAHGNETVLVVEDDPTVAGVSFQVLSRGGYRVLLADCGESAVGLLRGHAGEIALMIVDVILPDMSGPQMAEVAREVHPEAAVLFASGYSSESIAERADMPPDGDFIEKPYASDELLQRVRLAIDRRQQPAG